VSVTPEIASYLTKQHHCSPERIEIIGNGVNTEKFCPMSDVSFLSDRRRSLAIQPGDVVIAFVGNLALWQGLDTLVDSAAQLVTGTNGIKFLIVGDGRCKSQVQERASRQGLEKVFVFTGMIPYEEVPVLINMADICVAPFVASRNRETGLSPLKIYEYMACGKPVVASRVAGLEFVESNDLGRLVEPGDALSLEKALMDFILSPRKRAEVGSRGLQWAHERFGWDSRVNKIQKLLANLV
jgi:glycosyltransferase involved in cell wall biosynthesis